MNCPNCGGKMNEVKAGEHYYDREVVLEQCEKCGGLWFDKNEFYRVKVGEASNLEKIDTNKLTEVSEINDTQMNCPKDGHLLVLYKDLYAAKEVRDLKLFTCEKCNGFWFNRGEFTKFQGKVAEKSLKENNAASLMRSIAGLESYRDELQKIESLKPAGARAVMTYGAGRGGDGDLTGWGLGVVHDIILLIINAAIKR